MLDISSSIDMLNKTRKEISKNIAPTILKGTSL